MVEGETAFRLQYHIMALSDSLATTSLSTHGQAIPTQADIAESLRRVMGRDLAQAQMRLALTACRLPEHREVDGMDDLQALACWLSQQSGFPGLVGRAYAIRLATFRLLGGVAP